MIDKEPAVKVQKLTKKYGRYAAVNNISFEAYRGKVLAILGPNGAGKTTTIETLEGYRKPTSGIINVLGAEPKNATRLWRSKIGVVLQSTSLDEELTVKEILSMYERFYPNPRSVTEVLALVGLEGNAKKRVGHLSGGQQRRVDVALGIIGRPELLFLDEPTTGFDPVARRDSWNMIKQLCQEGMTVILTTHYMDEAKFLADRVLVLVDGQIVANAPPDEVGGSLRHQSIIGFNITTPEILSTLPTDIRDKLSINGNHVSLLTGHVLQAVEQLLNWARHHKLELRNLTITRPSLEEIYLQLVHKNRLSQS